MEYMQLVPIVSEKSQKSIEEGRTYIFKVPKSAGKISIKNAVNKRFDVKVQSVNTIVYKGKPKSSVVKRGSKSLKGTRSGYKKAYVTLAEGMAIDIFEKPKTIKKPKDKSKKVVKRAKV